MTTTNRFLNRLLVLLIGLVLLVSGGAVAVGALVPALHDPVVRAARDAVSPTAKALSGGSPWILWIAAAAALILIVLLLVFVFRQGRGRTGTLLRREERGARGSSSGAVVVDAKVAEQVLEEALARDRDILSVDVTAFEIRRRSILRVTVQARQGASPVELRRTVEDAIAEWDALLGAEVPVVVQFVRGLRARVAADARVA